MGGEMDGDLVTSGEDLAFSVDIRECSDELREWSGEIRECSGESLGGSGTVKFANREWKWAGDVAYRGAPNRGGRDSGGRYWAPNNGEFAYLCTKRNKYN